MTKPHDREKEINQLIAKDSKYEGRDRYFMDIDRMINEGFTNVSSTSDNTSDDTSSSLFLEDHE